MHLTGVVTGLSNRAYAELCGRQPDTAEFIQLLIDNRAVVVGKTKLLARTPDVIIKDVLAIGGRVVRPSHWPTKLLYPTEWFLVANNEQQQMNDKFLNLLKSYLGLKHIMFSRGGVEANGPSWKDGT
ncbi:hypothetical protein B0H67DRAFT_606478 [Lasiosphaeris hirsuta]|uniref:Uncharacterized protein n=1 Tax=Lasiosphaeris hirsuta TaxID=260670 RepID=A0AA40BCS2_9PEZI|nr:hypothetical protein B0H67DRAFT_606478 [Lasiosphaeris hirsuta]